VKNLTPSECGEIIWLTNSGWTPEAISKKTKIPTHTVSQIMVDACRDASQPDTIVRLTKEAREYLLIFLYSNRHSLQNKIYKSDLRIKELENNIRCIQEIIQKYTNIENRGGDDQLKTDVISDAGIAKEFLLKYMNENFKDKYFKGYIKERLADDFAIELANAIRTKC